MSRPLVVHVVYRFDTGGLENGVVNLINHMDDGVFRHAVMALTEVTDFANRIQRSDVEVISLHKPPGQGVWHYPRWWQQLRKLRPAIVHTRNLGALEMQVPAAFAQVPGRIHGEHGRDMSDPHGTVRKYQWMRRAYSPFVHRYVALSEELAGYLTHQVGLDAARVSTICNGVDSNKFVPPADGQAPAIPGCPFHPDRHFIIGTVGRLQPEKDQATLVSAFAQARALAPASMADARLVVVGEGPMRPKLEALILELGLGSQVWLAGARDDVASVLQGLHLFVLPSRAEGISNTVLEAMATGLPVVATDVGGNHQLVAQELTGTLVPAASPMHMAKAICHLVRSGQAVQFGLEARKAVDRCFSLHRMVSLYQTLYESTLHSGTAG